MYLEFQLGMKKSVSSTKHLLTLSLQLVTLRLESPSTAADPDVWSDSDCSALPLGKLPVTALYINCSSRGKLS